MAKKQTPPTTKNAAQRIESLEATVNALLNAHNNNMKSFEILAEEIDKVRELNLAVARRLNVAITVSESGQLTHEKVNAAIVDQNATNLKNSVDFMVKEGLLSPKEGEANGTDFIVARELKDDGSVINPRLQFSMVQMNSLEDGKKLVNAIIGKKVGDVVKKDENDTTSLEILEILSVNDEKEIQVEEQKEA